jgi:hypothetical protein
LNKLSDGNNVLSDWGLLLSLIFYLCETFLISMAQSFIDLGSKLEIWKTSVLCSSHSNELTQAKFE